ncbi:MAG: hypothetical protein QXH67_06065, partial [Candidatus Bathyarchaeia archaeon]
FNLLLFLLLILPLSLIFLSMKVNAIEVDPLVWHDYEYFNRGLDPGECFNSTREPYAVCVHISTISPPGYKLDVTIYVNGVPKWSGQLGVGKSSPTITCNDQSTTIHIANPNGNPYLQVSGYIDWVMH